jgi:hypothetical protein
VTDIVLSSVESENEVDHEIWIIDSGALFHSFNDNQDLYNYKTISEGKTMVGYGKVIIAKKVGKLRCGILQRNSKSL